MPGELRPMVIYASVISKRNRTSEDRRLLPSQDAGSLIKNPRSKLRGIGGRKEADQKNAASCGEYVPKEIQVQRSSTSVRQQISVYRRRYRSIGRFLSESAWEINSKMCARPYGTWQSTSRYTQFMTRLSVRTLKRSLSGYLSTARTTLTSAIFDR